MNLKGFYYLFLKETKRFLKVWSQTVLGPVIISLLFLFIFVVALGKNNSIDSSTHITFIEFLVPGLIIMQVVQNAFANTSSSILMAKVFGTINDIVTAPLNSKEIALAYIGASILRGFIVAVIIFITCFIVAMFNHTIINIKHLFLVVYFLLVSSFVMGSVGLLCGLWAANFDKIATVTNLIIMPLSFLSGTFYSVNNLPSTVSLFIYINPIFYMIDGFRYAFTGVSDFNIIIEAGLLFIMSILLFWICVKVIKRGYKIKS